MGEFGMISAYFALLSMLCIGFALYETGYGVCDTVIESFSKRLATFVVSLVSFTGISFLTDSIFVQNLPTLVLNLALLTVLTHIVSSMTRSLWYSCAISVVLGTVVYPGFIQMVGYGGILSNLGYYDVAGSGIVHFVGAVIALLMSVYLSTVHGIKHDTVKKPWLASLGFLFVWAAWLIFTLIVGAELITVDPLAWLRGFVVASTSAGWGAVASVAFTFLTLNKIRLKSCTVGGLAGLVIVSADPFSLTFVDAVLHGVLAGVLASLTSYILHRYRIKDPCSVISIHGPAGFIGVMLVALTNSSVELSSQLYGLSILCAFAVVAAVVLCQLAVIFYGLLIKGKLNLQS